MKILKSETNKKLAYISNLEDVLFAKIKLSNGFVAKSDRFALFKTISHLQEEYSKYCV